MANIARRSRRVRVAQPESINSPEGLELARAMKPDLLVVAAYGQILSKDVLTIPTRGTVNVHASAAAEVSRRGTSRVCHSRTAKLQTGVTIIKVTPGLDSGDMILQESLDILPDDTTGTLEASPRDAWARNRRAEVAYKYASGAPVEGGRSSDPALVTKARRSRKSSRARSTGRNRRSYIERFVRAMQPWPTAYVPAPAGQRTDAGD